MKVFDLLEETTKDLKGEILKETLVHTGTGEDRTHLNNGLHSTCEYYQEIFDVEFKKASGEVITINHRIRIDQRTQKKYEDYYYIPIPADYLE